METCSLIFTILSFVVAFVSLCFMWKIDQNTSHFNQKRAKKEDESNAKRDKKLDEIIDKMDKSIEETKFDFEANSKLPNIQNENNNITINIDNAHGGNWSFTNKNNSKDDNEKK